MSTNKNPLADKKLNFWNEENIKYPTTWGTVDKIHESNLTSLPNKFLSDKELGHMINVIGKKMTKYSDHKCFNYLEQSYQEMQKLLKDKQPEKVLEDYTSAVKNLHFFVSCWQDEREVSMRKHKPNNKFNF